jgi:hypothetical protein
MSNCGTIRARHSISLKRYYGLVQEAVEATYGDALKLDFDATNTDINCSGIGVSTDEGHFLFQLMMYSTRRIVVDHRRGEVGYMVADVIMQRLARDINGVWTEDAAEGAMDLDKDQPLYFVARVRKTYAHSIEKHGWDDVRGWVDDLRELYFTGKFAKFWSKE